MKFLYIFLGVIVLSITIYFNINIKYVDSEVSVEFDVSKEGYVYETVMTVPYTLYTGYTFSIGFEELDKERFHKEIKENVDLTIDKVIGIKLHNSTKYKEAVMRLNGVDIKVKVTITPLNKNNIEPMNCIIDKYQFITTYKKYCSTKKGKPIEATIELYNYSDHVKPTRYTRIKNLVTVGLQRGEQYHIKVENLNAVSLPKDILTTFVIGQLYRKKP